MKPKTSLLLIMPWILLWAVSPGYAGPVSPGARPQKTSPAGKAAAADPARSSQGHVLRFGVHVSGMGKLDPHFAAGSQDRALADMVFNGLLRYQPGNAPKIEPDLALAMPDFDMVDGRQVWTIKLRQGVMFHPGPASAAYEMTAEDVVFSLYKSADRRFCAYAGEYAGMTFKAVDRYTVQITLQEPISAVLFLPKLTNYAGGFIVSKKAIQAMGYDRFASHPVGTGPFIFKSYHPGKALILDANQRYFRGRPLLDGVEIHFLPDIKVREKALKSGEMDVILGSAENGWPEKMEAEPGIVVDAHGVGEVSIIYLNTEQKPLDDIRVRKAFTFALNRRVFLETASKRMVSEALSPIPEKFQCGGLARAEVHKLGLSYDTNLSLARQLLTEAGYPHGFTLNLVSSEKRVYRTEYEVMRRLLAKVGIICNIKVVSHSQMHKQIRRTPLPVVIYIAWRPNPDAYLSHFFHSDAIVVTGAKPDTNFSHYGKVDRLIDEARLEINPEKQINLWKQAQVRILDDMAAYPIMYSIQCFARRANVDYGHVLVSTMALYPQFTEKTRLKVGL